MQQYCFLRERAFTLEPVAVSSYLPVYCATCARASLSQAEGEVRAVRCAFCEETARVIPGPIYDDGDWLAFADIDKAIYEADLDAPAANALTAQLQQMLDRKDAPLAIVDQMLALLPRLAEARPALVNRLPRGPRMLMALLTARTREDPAGEEKSGPVRKAVTGSARTPLSKTAK